MNNPYKFAQQDSVISPQLVVYPEVIEANIKKMIEVAGAVERLWPHVKTHKMAEVVKLQLKYGIVQFKCATIAEAQMCAEAGAKRVTLAYPLLGPNVERFLTLMRQYADTEFFAIADDTQQVCVMGKVAHDQNMEIPLLMDVDMGLHRTGVAFGDVVSNYKEWNKMQGIKLCGLHCYDGHRHETDITVRDANVRKEDDFVIQIKKELVDSNYDCSIVILGGTPSFPCHAAYMEDFLSPGTCVLQDAGYQAAYPDLDFQPAAAVLTRVVSRPEEDMFTLDMGTKAVATDPLPERAKLVGMEYAVTVLQNEEHWTVRVPKEHVADIPPIGSVMYAIPHHICPTSALYPEAAVIRGKELCDWWEVTARNRKITI